MSYSSFVWELLNYYFFLVFINVESCFFSNLLGLVLALLFHFLKRYILLIIWYHFDYSNYQMLNHCLSSLCIYIYAFWCNSTRTVFYIFYIKIWANQYLTVKTTKFAVTVIRFSYLYMSWLVPGILRLT